MLTKKNDGYSKWENYMFHLLLLFGCVYNIHEHIGKTKRKENFIKILNNWNWQIHVESLSRCTFWKEKNWKEKASILSLQIQTVLYRSCFGFQGFAVKKSKKTTHDSQ